MGKLMVGVARVLLLCAVLLALPAIAASQPIPPPPPPAPQPPPHLTLSLNPNSFQPGDTHILTVIVTPGGSASPMDVYLAIQLPDQTLLFYQSDGSFTQEVQPLVANWTVTPFIGEVFRYTFSGTEPAGTYTWYGAFTAPGTLNFIGDIAQAPFTFNTNVTFSLPAETWLKWPASGTISANVAWHLAIEGVRAVDIANHEGTPIAAAHSGTVTYAGTTSDMFFCTFVEPHRWTEGNGFGNFVVIRHDGGEQTYYTMYTHLSSVAVTIGQQVITGEFIGRMGSTGCSSGPHLHFVIGTSLVGPPEGDVQTPYVASSSSVWVGPDPSIGTSVYFDNTVDGSDNYPGLSGPITLLTDALQVYEVWTTAEDFRRKDVFDCGDRINYVASVTNTSNRTIVARFTFYAKDPVPDDPFHFVVDDAPVFPGTASFYSPFTLPSTLPPPGDGTYYSDISVRNTSMNIYDIGTHPFSIRPDRCSGIAR